MSELQAIEFALERAARRRRWERALRGVAGVARRQCPLPSRQCRLQNFPDPVQHRAVERACGAGLRARRVCSWRLAQTGAAGNRPLGGPPPEFEGTPEHRLEVSGKPETDMWRETGLFPIAAIQAKQLDPRPARPVPSVKATRWARLGSPGPPGLALFPNIAARNFSSSRPTNKPSAKSGQAACRFEPSRDLQKTPARVRSRRRPRWKPVANLGDEVHEKKRVPHCAARRSRTWPMSPTSSKTNSRTSTKIPG